MTDVSSGAAPPTVPVPVPDSASHPDGPPARRGRRRHRAAGTHRAGRRTPRWIQRIAVSAALGSLTAALLQPALHDPAEPSARTTSVTASPPTPPGPSSVLPVGSLDPVRYGAEGCVALPPTTGDRNLTVFLDAGHGAPDPGAIATTASGQRLAEKDLTLAVTRETADGLRARGYRVALSRASDALGLRLTPGDLSDGALSDTSTLVQLAARAQCANLAGAAVLVSIHLNSFADPEVGGAETLYEPDRPFGSANRRLATLLQRNILRSYADAGRPVPDRGVLGGSSSTGEPAAAESGDLVILGPARPGLVDEPSSMPGALIEPLFITNPAEANLAASIPGRRALAQAVTRSVDQFFQQP